MEKTRVIKRALANAIITAIYVVLIGSFIYFGEKIFGEAPNILIPIVMLMLLVFSVALTGFLIFGKPVMLYLDNKKKEAISLLGYTLGFLFAITLIVFSFLTVLIL